MKLRGKNVKKIPKDKKKKLQSTLNRMEKTRNADSAHLRDLIKAKLQWALTEQKKGLNLIEQTKIQVQRLEGIILFIDDILYPEKKGQITS